MKLGVVGLGLLGGSLALDLRPHNLFDAIIGVENDPNHCKEALKIGLVDRVLSLQKTCEIVDLLIIAIPVEASVSVISEALAFIKPDTTVMDVGSTKLKISEHFKGHSKRTNLVLTHPMAGTEFSGPTAAIKGLFQGKATVFCDIESSGTEHVTLVRKVCDLVGLRTITMSSVDHDLHVAYVSHLSHVSSFLLANTVLAMESNESNIFDLASGGFESTVRLAKSSPEMWTSIFQHNQDNVAFALAAYISQLQDFQNKLLNNEFDALKATMIKANDIRRVLSRIGGAKT